MRSDRVFKMTRGLSVVASSAFLLLSAMGTASAHPAGTATRIAGSSIDDLRARILCMEPDLDEHEIDAILARLLGADEDDAAGASEDDRHAEDHRRGRGHAVGQVVSDEDDDRAESEGSDEDDDDGDKDDDDSHEGHDGDHDDGDDDDDEDEDEDEDDDDEDEDEDDDGDDEDEDDDDGDDDD
jgi:hypothetical protein